jgi:hypothetical protein
MSRSKLCRLTPAQLRLLPREINERTAGGLQWTGTRITDKKFFAPVCRRKIIFLHLLPSVATTFPKPLQNVECEMMNGEAQRGRGGGGGRRAQMERVRRQLPPNREQRAESGLSQAKWRAK